QNFTDVEDSIVKRAARDSRTPGSVADEFTASYFEDMDSLGVRRADAHPKVSDHIPEILDIVTSFVDHGCAYVSGDSVYFDTGKCGIKEGPILEKVAGKIPDDPRRKNPLDCLIWKVTDSGPRWDSPWGKGRPGWHVECTAMAYKHLGTPFDLHGGGQDLIFPHHTFEKMIGEQYTGEDYCRTFMHNAFINVREKKMSKRLGNFITVREMLKTTKPDHVRWFILKSHYRTNVSYSDEDIAAAGREFEAVRKKLGSVSSGEGEPLSVEALRDARLKANEALRDNFQTNVYLKTITEALGPLDRPARGGEALTKELDSLAKEIGRVLGFQTLV
ncbi:MAG TPA: class I tRNA ligase family protein, partial [Thermoplasmata archaeon]|nr:class I tRNA ligase family protein [Thermoplasmata archaeon]